jgi:hypothetical protein
MDELKDLKKTVKFSRLDDTGENVALEKALKQHHLGLQIEFSVPRTPQRSGKVERKFQTLYGRIRAMVDDLAIVDGIRDGLGEECASTASFYDNRIVNKETQPSALQLMHNKQFKGVVTTKKTIQGKLNERGTAGLFVGYPDNHANDVYRIFNAKTKEIIKARDLVWLNLSYGNWNKSKNNNIHPQDDEDTTDTEATTEDASDLAKTEDATLDEDQKQEAKQSFKKI